MRLYLGGRAQGKTELVKKRHPGAEIWNGFHTYVKEELESGKEPSKIWEDVSKRIDKCPELIIISDEIGNGIVPMDKDERRWREETGRILCKIAQRAECVERVTCGISVRIK